MTPYRENALALPERQPLWRLVVAWVTRPWRRMRAALEASELNERRRQLAAVEAVSARAVAAAERKIAQRLLPPPMPRMPPMPPMPRMPAMAGLTEPIVRARRRASRSSRVAQAGEASDRLLAVTAGAGVVTMLVATALTLVTRRARQLEAATPQPPPPDPLAKQ